MRKAGVLLATLAVVVTAGAHAGPSATPRAASDVQALGAALEANHPNLFRNVSRPRFRSEVASLARRAPALSDNELLVGLMRIAALPGVRNGHTGLFPLDGQLTNEGVWRILEEHQSAGSLPRSISRADVDAVVRQELVREAWEEVSQTEEVKRNLARLQPVVERLGY